MAIPVVAIALDAQSPVLLERWLEDGHLPHIAALRRDGVYGWLHNPPLQPYENSWSAFLHGATADATGQCGHQSYDSGTYTVVEEPAYDFSCHTPFYALEPGRCVAVLDLNLTRPVPGLNGVQMLGWGTEDNQCLRVSEPANRMAEVIARHGEHALFAGGVGSVSSRDAGEVLTYRTPNVYDLASLQDLSRRLIAGTRQRTALLEEMLAQGPWDALLASYSEPHTAGHLLWHLGWDHPISPPRGSDTDPLLEVARGLDDAVGRLRAAAPPQACFALFSVFGMKPNVLDLVTTLFLPELLFRDEWGEPALAPGEADGPVPAPPRNDRSHWMDSIWATRTPLGERLLESPAVHTARGDPLDWNPLNWYQPLWPRMRAFALPSYSHGMVRLNVQGRDGSGVVPAPEYDAECGRLEAVLGGLSDARTGAPLVREVVRTRRRPEDPGLGSCPADLVVVWDERHPVDCVEAPGVGRIGPVPYFRTGGHATHGFGLLAGPGIPAGGRLPEDATVPDLSATLLAFMGVTAPPYMEGRPFWGAA